VRTLRFDERENGMSGIEEQQSRRGMTAVGAVVN
jgi:hypothetical protein